jgi:hypothetical protein
MFGALLYLRFTSLTNWLLTRLKALRQPKQLAGAIAFGAYFWFFFLRHWTSAPRVSAAHHAAAVQALQDAGAALPPNWPAVTLAFGALALFTFTALMWIVPTQRAALGFSEAEIAFLFPAPVGRRALVHFRLLSGQFRSLVGATIMMLISNRWSFLGGNALTHALGWWFVFSALNLHYSGATFTLTRLSDAGLGSARRRILVLALVIAAIAATIWRLPAAARLPMVEDAASLRTFTNWVTGVSQAAPLGWLLWPFKLVLGPFLAADSRAFLLALGPALVVIVVHYLWVVRAAVAFEDASIDFAQKRSARVAAWRSGQRRFGGAPSRARGEPFPLADHGRAEFAFLWKNLLSTWPYFNVRVWLISVALILGTVSWVNAHAAWRGLLLGVGMFVGAFSVYLLVIGPQFARQDIRSDMAHADILKTYPLPGWRVVLGEMLAPVAILTGLLWLALLVFLLALQPGQPGFTWLTPQLRLAGGVSIAAVLPAVVSLQLLVPNAAALVFPTWFQASRGRGGPEVAGQRMIFLFAQLLAMVVALLPAAGFSALLLFIIQPLLGLPLAVVFAALTLVVVVIGEVWCGVWLLGQRFEKLDLSSELRP